MKKKIYMMIFAFVAFLFMGVVNVNAETYTVTTNTAAELEEHLFSLEGIAKETTIKLGNSMSTNSINENDELGVYVKHNLTIDLNGKTLTTDSRLIFFSYYGAHTVNIIDTSAERTGKIVVPGNEYNGFLLQMLDDNNWDGTSKLILDGIYVENINSGNKIFRIDNSGDQYNKFDIRVKNSILINSGETIEYTTPNNNFSLKVEPTTTFLTNNDTKTIFVTNSLYLYSQYITAADTKVRVKDTSTSAERELDINSVQMDTKYYSIRFIPKNAETYNITLEPTTNGVVTGRLLTDVVSGEKRTLTINPNAGYMIDEVLVNDIDKVEEVENNKITLNVDGNKTVKVSFKKIVYNMTKGKDLKTSDLTKLTFTIDADYSKFENGGMVFVDGSELTSSQFTSRAGSTIVTLDEEYAGTLSFGNHEIEIIFNDEGVAQTTFTIEKRVIPVVNPGDTPIVPAKEEIPEVEDTPIVPVEEEISEIQDIPIVSAEEEIPEVEDTQTTPVVQNPQTGDNITISIILGILSVMGIVGTPIYTKKRFN